jgi:hypothetical protein
MHPTRDTLLVINPSRAGGRVMPGVRSLERAGLRTRAFQPGALERPNNGMHPTRDTPALINHNRVGGRVMPGVRFLSDDERP